MFDKYRILRENKVCPPKDDPKAIVFNLVNYDGIGDFSHFRDIYLELKNNPKMKAYQFIPAIAYRAEWQYELIKQQLQEMGISYYFLAPDEDFEKKFEDNKNFLKDLRDAQQFITISFWHFPAIEKWRNINPNIPFKFIGEHEIDYGYEEGCARSLGLSPRHYGIKLGKHSRLKPQEATTLIEKKEKDFTKRLLERTQSEDFKHFHQHHFLIPAYFNKITGLARFIRLLSLNKSLPPDKNLVLFLSGNGLKEYPDSLQEYISAQSKELKQSEFSVYLNRVLPKKESRVGRVMLVEAESSDPVTYTLNPKEKRTIFIFYGFKLGKASYEALYQQALLAGVSGDNTFELAAGLTLPYYLSSNARNKGDTLRGLITIVKKLKLPDTVTVDFISYFGLNTEESPSQEEEKTIFKEINLEAMIKAWPVVADYLIKHHNFYDRLENIFFESRFKMQSSFYGSQVVKRCQSLSCNRNILYAAAIGITAVAVASSLSRSPTQS